MKNDNSSALAVVYKPLGNLTAFSSNARSHSKPQIRQIAASIEQFGFTNPILINNKNTIIAGHGRVAARQAIGYGTSAYDSIGRPDR